MKKFVSFWVNNSMLGSILRAIFGENFVEEKPHIANGVAIFIILILCLVVFSLFMSGQE
jgi:hypothetical protein